MYLRQYLDCLIRETTQKNERNASEEGVPLLPMRLQHLPFSVPQIEHQILSWWQYLPPCQRKRKFQLWEVSAICQGKTGNRPADRDIAEALRSLGWTECRDWTREGRNRRYWAPPVEKNSKTDNVADGLSTAHIS
jgi:hypothetical protein